MFSSTLSLLVAAVLAQVPTGESRRTEPSVAVYDAAFDGRVLTGLFIVCASSESLFLDSSLSLETFRITRVAACGSTETRSFRTYDYGPAKKKPRSIEVPPSTCVGRRVTVRLAAESDPELTGPCFDMEISAGLLTSKGQPSDFIRSKTVVRGQ